MSKAPTLPLYARSLGLGLAAIGVVCSASTVTGIFVNFIGGWLSDLYGRRRLLLASGVVFLSAPLLYFAARGALSLAAVRAYYGAATAIFVPVSYALVSDLYPEHRGAFMGLLSSLMLAGRALAPSIAGALIYLRGFHPVFLLCSATGAVVLLLLSQVSEARGRAGAAGGFGLSWGVALVGAVEASCYMGYQAFETYLPLFESMKGAEWLSGLLLSFMIAVMAFLKPLAGYLSDRVGRGKPIA
ncbi:MAG: hypothetical protein DRN99_06840, partial [Thermoproteota archaeon]